MKKLMIFSLVVLTQSMALADTNVYSYQDENSKAASFEVYDVAGSFGEEQITWQDTEGKKTVLQFLSASIDSYEAALSVQANGSQIPVDLNISLSLGESFAQIKEMMRQKDFRDTFTYLPESCSESSVGFALIANNLNMDMKGYCLSK